ncbi:hypothetical protein D6777_01885, partial [Candidatus Woesearchaeota archaeon]
KKSWLVYFIFAIIAYLGYKIRTKNLPLLQDKYPLALDPYVFLRYAQYLLEHGKLMAVDMMRYYPWGYSNMDEFRVLTHVMVYLYKFMHFFNSSITLEKAVILYPAIAFVGGLIFFFLLVKKVFNWKIALLSSAFLTVIPAYLYRTMAGFSDKEALAMMLFFMVLYFLVKAWDEKSVKKQVIYALIAGVANGLMGLTWGGVNFLFLIVSSTALVLILLNKFEKNYFYTYSIWLISWVLILNIGYKSRYGLANLLSSVTTMLPLFVLFAGITYNYLNIKKIKLDQLKKIPNGVMSVILPLLLGTLALLLLYGPSFFVDKINQIYINFIEPFGTTRWALTVAESHQPYFTDWIGQFRWSYLLLMFAGAGILFYELIKRLNKKTWQFTLAFVAFILMFSMSRYSQSSTFNGVTNISKLVYIGSFVVFVALLIYAYYQLYKFDKGAFSKLKKLNSNYILILLWFFFMLVAARSAIRLVFVFAPVTAVMVGYAGIKFFDYAKKYVSNHMLKLGAYVLIVIVIGNLLFINYKATTAQAQYTGPSFNPQWQQAMKWVKENTPEDAVFAHWWDYGYWVQTGGRRATLSDGGNAFGGINHFIGRHVLTGHSEREALEYLKARNATHLLIIKDEIGKYPAYSSIGADKDYDRYSWIPTFTLDPQQIMETRNATIYLYKGGTPVDHDIIYNDMLFPANSAGVGGFFVKVQNVETEDDNGTKKVVQKLLQPEMVLFYNGQQVRAPVNCVYYNNQKIEFNNPKAINACLRIIPTIQSQGSMNPMGALLYLSPEVSQTNMARLFLMNQKSDYFKLVYSDEERMPLALYNGMLIGPLKIWEITYPDDLVIPQEYYGWSVPEEVTRVKR